MRIPKPVHPPTLTVQEACIAFGRKRNWFYKSKVADFLEYYQENNEHRAYLADDVRRFQYWLMVRDGMISLGHWTKNTARLLPDGKTMEAKRARFEAWLVEDLYGVECPKCDGPAVQGEMGGNIWCKICGIRICMQSKQSLGER